MGYAKLFASLLDSTVWREPDHVRLTWIAMLAKADQDGLVEAAVPGLADAARVTVAQCEEALIKFLSPDKYSRTKRFDGRRIAEVEGGWLLLNYERYRDKMSADEQRAKAAARQQRKRDRDAAKRDASRGACDGSRSVTVPSACDSVSVSDLSLGVLQGGVGGAAPPLSAPPSSVADLPVSEGSREETPDDFVPEFDEPTRGEIPQPVANAPESPPVSGLRRGEPPPAPSAAQATGKRGGLRNGYPNEPPPGFNEEPSTLTRDRLPWPMTDDWDPGPGVLIGSTVPPARHTVLLALFRPYWRERGEQRTNSHWRGTYVSWAQQNHEGVFKRLERDQAQAGKPLTKADAVMQRQLDRLAALRAEEQAEDERERLAL
jgi:hypothetical protein